MEKLVLVKEEGNEIEVVKDGPQHKELIKAGWRDKNAPKKPTRADVKKKKSE